MQLKRELRWLKVHFRSQWWLQAAMLGFIWAVCDLGARNLHLPLPGSVIGLAAVLLALEMRLISIRWLRRGASKLLANLVLFFVPAMLAVVNHRELMSSTGLKLLAAVFIGTPLVIIGTAAAIEIAFRMESSRER